MERDAALTMWTTLRDRVIADADELLPTLDVLSAHVCTALRVGGAGVLVASSGQRQTVLGASDERMRRLEQLQATFDEGPCLDAYNSGRFAGAAELSHDGTRWP